MQKLKYFGIISVIALVTSLLVGCNTMQGLGQDITAGGQALTRAADKDKNSNNGKTKNNSSSATAKTSK